MARINEVHQEFQKRLQPFGQVVIAGGAARDSLMGKEPKDWDIFVLQGNQFDFETAKDEIGLVLSDLSTVPPVVEWHKSEPFLVATVAWRDLEIQVLVNPAASLGELLDTFDWNVCLFGYNGTYLSMEEVGNIGPSKSLRLHRVTYPVSTLRRGFRFSERFKMKLERTDLLTLCRTIVQNADSNAAGPDEPDAPAIGQNLLIEDNQ